MNKLVLVVCTSLGLLACGSDDDGSGLPDSKVIGTLSASEAMAFCNELEASFPQRTVDCGGGAMVTVGFEADCSMAMARTTCTATVGNFRDCFGDLDGLSDAQLCDDTTPAPASCAPVLSAGCTGQ